MQINVCKIKVNQGAIPERGDVSNQVEKQCSVPQTPFNLFPTILSSQNWLMNKVVVAAGTKLCMGSLNNTYCWESELPAASWHLVCAHSVVTLSLQYGIVLQGICLSTCGKLPTLILEEAVFTYPVYGFTFPASSASSQSILHVSHTQWLTRHDGELLHCFWLIISVFSVNIGNIVIHLEWEWKRRSGGAWNEEKAYDCLEE